MYDVLVPDIEPLLTDLLADMSADSLALLLGAGLSMAPPSTVPSAWDLAQQVAQEYQKRVGQDLPNDVSGDLEKLADWFYDKAQLELQFVDQLVHWPPFRGEPNPAHVAVADFLITGAAQAGVTTNVDWLVERAAERLGELDFRTAIDVQEATKACRHRPYVKLHGCVVRDRRRTIWTRRQLAHESEQTRIELLREWLTLALQNKTLVVVGFWSDWGYLNEALESAVVTAEPQRVVVVDLAPADVLEKKAPALWKWANGPKVKFAHVQVSGVEFLRRLRARFIQQFLGQLWNDSGTTYQDVFKTAPTAKPDLSTLSDDELHLLRRDACGARRDEALRTKRPEPHQRMVGAAHLWLASNGAVLNGPFFVCAGKRARVIDGAGQTLSQVRRTHLQSVAEISDVVICAGAIDDGGVPEDIVRGGAAPTITRQGVGGHWVTLNGARVVLGV